MLYNRGLDGKYDEQVLAHDQFHDCFGSSGL